jgi:hypothetical protein
MERVPLREQTTQTAAIALKDQVVQMERVKSELDHLSTEFNDIRDSVKAASNLPEKSKLSFQLQQIQKSVADIQNREGQLEQVILTSASRALEIPLIKRDLENLKATQQTAILTIKEDFDRTYDLSKWLLGALAVGIITLAIGNFLKA